MAGRILQMNKARKRGGRMQMATDRGEGVGWGEKMRRRCAELGLNQRDVMRLSGVPNHTVSRIQRGADPPHWAAVAIEVAMGEHIDPAESHAPPALLAYLAASSGVTDEERRELATIAGHSPLWAFAGPNDWARLRDAVSSVIRARLLEDLRRHESSRH